MCILQQAILQKALPLHCLRYTHACRLQHECSPNAHWTQYLHYTRACRLQRNKIKDTRCNLCLHYTRACRLQRNSRQTIIAYFNLHYTRACRLQLQKHKYRWHTGLISYALTLSSVSTIRKNYVFYNVLSRFTDAKPPGLNVNYTFALNLYYNTARLSCQYL